MKTWKYRILHDNTNDVNYAIIEEEDTKNPGIIKRVGFIDDLDDASVICMMANYYFYNGAPRNS